MNVNGLYQIVNGKSVPVSTGTGSGDPFIESRVSALEKKVVSGSTTQEGLVQLSSSTDSDSETTAATSKAVKTLADSIANITDDAEQGLTAHNNNPDAHSNFRTYKGATSSTNGVAGLVPAATKEEYNKFLRADGSWVTPETVSSVDNITTALNNNNIIVKDIAINGNVSDLASKRGQIGAAVQKNYQLIPTLSFNDFTVPGTYVVWWGPDTEGRPEYISKGTGVLQVDGDEIGNCTQTLRIIAIAGGVGYASGGIHFRKANKLVEGKWSTWQRMLNTDSIGDGIHMGANGVFSVPEYQGATSSENGISGLVPPASAGVDNRYLNAYGDWVHGSTAEILKSAKTIYVRIDGNDSNDGSSNDSAHALRTIQAAINMAMSKYLFWNGCTIQLGEGTWNETIRIGSINSRYGSLTIKGSGTSTIIENTNTGFNSIFLGVGVTISNLTIKYTRNNNNVQYVISSGTLSNISLSNVNIEIIDNAEATNSGLSIFSSEGIYSLINVTGNNSITITGTNTKPAITVFSSIGGYVQNTGTLNITGNFFYFAYIRRGGFATFSSTYPGVCKGTRYKVEWATICVSGKGPEYLPGDTEGIIGTLGNYK